MNIMVETGGTPELLVYKNNIRRCQTALAYSGLHHSQGRHNATSKFSVNIFWLRSNILYQLTLSWPAGHISPTYKETFQVSWNKSIPLFLHAAIYLEVSLFRWTSQNAFSHIQIILCAMLLCSIAHSIICTWGNALWLVQWNRDTLR